MKKLYLMMLTVLILCNSVIQAALIPVDSFDAFLPEGTKFIQSLHSEYDDEETTDELMIRDPVTGQDSAVATSYKFGMIRYADEGAVVVGYGENPHWDSDYGQYFENWRGVLLGFYVGTVKQKDGTVIELLDEGRRADDIWIVSDGRDNGIGYFNTRTGVWMLGEDDILYTSEDILFGDDEIRGDVSQLPPHYRQYESAILPHMVIAPVPEPGTLCLLALGGLMLHKRKMNGGER